MPIKFNIILLWLPLFCSVLVRMLHIRQKQRICDPDCIATNVKQNSRVFLHVSLTFRHFPPSLFSSKRHACANVFPLCQSCIVNHTHGTVRYSTLKNLKVIVCVLYVITNCYWTSDVLYLCSSTCIIYMYVVRQFSKLLHII